MSTEYIWFKRGKEHRRTADPEGKRPTLIKPTPNTEIRYQYYYNGDLWSERHYKNGELHRDDDKPAFIKYDNTDPDLVRSEEYHKNGKLHRSGKPASIEYAFTGGLIQEEYFENGVYHRSGEEPTMVEYDSGVVRAHSYLRGHRGLGEFYREGDKPSFIKFYNNGNVASETYIKGQEEDRDGDKPAYVRYYEDGALKTHRFYINGLIHRGGDKPAWIGYYKNGDTKLERYYEADVPHRGDDKPADIRYYKDGSISYADYYEYGVRYNP